MLNYFKLQLLLSSRRLKDAGVHPLPGLVLILIVFIAGSLFLFYKTEYATYIYLFVAVSFVNPLSDKPRNDFLKVSFGNAQYRKVRILENMLVVSPFVLFLFFKLQFVWAGVLVLTAVLWVFNTASTKLNFTMPTPFTARPYEFAVGFRGTYYIVGVAYGLTAIAIGVSNFNLGIFALLLVFAVVLSYYLQPDEEYYVWSHSATPSKFMWGKVVTAYAYSSLLAFPIVICLAVFFKQQAIIPFAVMFLSYLYIACTVAARYSAYPNEISLPQGILLTLSLLIPPALIFTLPYLINAAVNRLRPVLK